MQPHNVTHAPCLMPRRVPHLPPLPRSPGRHKSKNNTGDTGLMGPFTSYMAFLSGMLRVVAMASVNPVCALTWPNVAACLQEGHCSELPDSGPGLCLPGLGCEGLAATYFLVS